MLLDSLFAAALADELRADLLGGRVQDVVQPHRLGLALELYVGRRVYLELSAAARGEGFLLTDRRPRRGEGAPTPLTLGARARLVGARLRDVVHPPHERILWLEFEGAERWRLVAEMMGRMANVILVAPDGVVAAAARRVTPDMTRARVVLPGRPYVPPPPPDKVAPEALQAADVAAWLAAAPKDPAWRSLVRNVRGLSPLAAREAVCRAAGADGGLDAESLHAALTTLFAPTSHGRFEPSVARSGDAVVAYAAYRLSPGVDPKLGITAVQEAASPSAALRAYAEASAPRDPYRDARAAVAGELAMAREALERRAAALARERWDEADVEALREAGDLILTHQTRVRRGDSTLEAPDLAGGDARSIELDPALGPVENAQRYYERYRSRKRAIASFDERMHAVEVETETLDQLALDLELAEDRPGIDAVHDALVEAGAVAGRRTRGAAPSKPLALPSSDGFQILVGRSSRQNERVTFEMAARGDLWLHVRGAPGGHVVVKSAGRPVPESTVLEAAALAGHYSRLRAEAAADVIVTDVRHVRRVRGGGPGLARYDHERTVTVEPRSPAELGLA